MTDKFGKNVKKYRESLGMSQEQLARAVGYTAKSAISMIESGKRDVRPNHIIKIANALHVDVSDLLSDPDAEQELIAEYAQDEHLRRLILFAGANIPKSERERYVAAVIQTIETLNNFR